MRRGGIREDTLEKEPDLVVEGMHTESLPVKVGARGCSGQFSLEVP